MAIYDKTWPSWIFFMSASKIYNSLFDGGGGVGGFKKDKLDINDQAV